MYTYLAVDSATHIAEEVPKPGKKVPQTMGMTVLIGVVTVIPWTLAFMFSAQDFDKISSSALPIMELYYQALRHSRAGAAFFTTWLLFVYFGACIACTVSTSRQIWAFARDNGMPFSDHLSKVDKRFEVPVNAALFTGVFCTLYGLIYIGSTTAFNSFIAMSILSLNLTYAIPQAVVLFRGRSKVLPARSFNLGPIMGRFCNLFSTLWVALFTVIFCFPVFRPVTAGSMNYVSVIIAGVFVFVAALWFLQKRKTFTGPNVELEGLDLVRSMSINGLGKDGESVSVEKSADQANVH